MKKQISRRSFLHHSLGAGLALSLPALSSSPGQPLHSLEENLDIHLFSKHLQFLDYDEMAERLQEMGFAGADLTVRPGGHVLPERVEEDLPRAVAALQKQGLNTTMMTTAVTNAGDPVNRTLLKTAADVGIRHYRTGWLRYPDDQSIPQAMAAFKPQMADLAALNAELGLHGGYQNHSGLFVGAAIWEIWELLEDADPEGLGCQYDIRHATVEGGLSWPTGLRLIAPRIDTIILKDFRWEKRDGKWQAVNTPLGEGMVDFKAYFKLLKQYGIRVPVSLHLEYDLGGAQHGHQDINMPRERIYAHMKKDLETAQRLWKEA